MEEKKEKIIETEPEDFIVKADKAAKRLEEAHKKTEELLQRQEQLMARDRLSGRSEAGKPQKTEQDLKNEKDQADADQIFHSIYSKKKR